MKSKYKNNDLTESNVVANKRVDTNASPSAYGWCFQVGAGITLIN